MLQGRSRADGEKIMDLARLGNDFRRGLQIAEPPACDRERLAQRTAGQRPLRHAGKRREIRVHVRRVDNVFVHFVGDHPHVVFFGQPGDLLQFAAGENFPRGIGRVAEHKRLQARRERAPQFLRIEGVVGRMQPDMHRGRPGENRIGAVVFIKR